MFQSFEAHQRVRRAGRLRIEMQTQERERKERLRIARRRFGGEIGIADGADDGVVRGRTNEVAGAADEIRISRVALFRVRAPLPEQVALEQQMQARRSSLQPRQPTQAARAGEDREAAFSPGERHKPLDLVRLVGRELSSAAVRRNGVRHGEAGIEACHTPGFGDQRCELEEIRLAVRMTRRFVRSMSSIVPRKQLPRNSW